MTFNGLAGVQNINKVNTPLSYQQYLNNVGGFENSDYFDNADFEANAGSNYTQDSSGAYTNDMGLAREAGGVDYMGLAKLGMDLFGGYMDYKNYGLQKKAINENIKNAKMTRQTTGLAGLANANTKLAFANATGQNTDNIAKNKAIFEGYAGTSDTKVG